MRGKAQIKSAFIMGRESTASQMLLYGKYMLFLNKVFDVDERLKKLENITIKDVREVIDCSFDIESAATATIGVKRSPVKI